MPRWTVVLRAVGSRIGLQLLASGYSGLDRGDLAEPALVRCLPEPVAEVGARSWTSS
jgi:hypothetical protein